ncbi:hypothetical protein LTS18_009134, partial [Coniosporium uncinatum]
GEDGGIRRRLDVEVEATGFSRKMAKELEGYQRDVGAEGFGDTKDDGNEELDEGEDGDGDEDRDESVDREDEEAEHDRPNPNFDDGHEDATERHANAVQPPVQHPDSGPHSQAEKEQENLPPALASAMTVLDLLDDSLLGYPDYAPSPAAAAPSIKSARPTGTPTTKSKSSLKKSSGFAI